MHFYFYNDNIYKDETENSTVWGSTVVYAWMRALSVRSTTEGPCLPNHPSPSCSCTSCTTDIGRRGAGNHGMYELAQV